MYRDAEIILNKWGKFKDLKNNASPNNKICSYISYFMPVRMKLCQSKRLTLHKLITYILAPICNQNYYLYV